MNDQEEWSGRSLIYGRIGVESKMELWGTPAFMEYSCKKFQYRTEKRRNKAKTQAWNSLRADFEKKKQPAKPCQKPLIYHISSAAGLVVPDLLKTWHFYLIQLWEELLLNEETWNHVGNQEKGDISRSDQKALFTPFSKTLLTTKRRLSGWYFSVVGLCLTFLNTGTIYKTFQKLENKIPLNTE